MRLPDDIVPDRDEARRRQVEDPLLGSAATAAEAAGLACPDAEWLGLYAEGALSRSEAATIEAHVQGCARCEEVVAAIARALPAAAAPDEAEATTGVGVTGWLRGWRWMVPAMSLAGAAAVALWLGRSPAPVAEMDLARTEAGPSASPAIAADELTQSFQRQQDRAKESASTATTNAAPAVEAAPAAKRLAEAAARRDAALKDQGQAEPAAAPTAIGGLLAETGTRSADAAKQKITEATAATDAASAPVPSREAAAAAPPAPAAPAIAAAPRTAAAPAEREERARTNAVGATAQTGDTGSGAPAGGAAAGGAASGARAADLRAPFERWRVRNGRLEFARDGKAWRRVTLPTSERVASVTERPDGTVLVITAAGAQFVSANLGATWERQ